MQQKFLLFSEGIARSGLLQLRTTVAAELLSCSYTHLMAWHHGQILVSMAIPLALASGVLLLRGYLTPVAAPVTA